MRDDLDPQDPVLQASRKFQENDATRSTVAILLMCALASACDGPAPREAGASFRDSAGVRIVELAGDPFPAAGAIPLPVASIGMTDAAGHDLYAVTDACRLGSGEIVLANAGSQEIRLFTGDGTFVRRFGGQGEGPGEFATIAWLACLPADTIVAYDPRALRLSRFLPDGTFLGSVPPIPTGEWTTPEVRGLLDGGRQLIVPGASRLFVGGEHRDTLTVVTYAPGAGSLDTLGTLPGQETFILATPEIASRSEVIFGRDAFVEGAGDVVVMTTNDRFEIPVHRADGSLRAVIRADPAPRAVGRADVDAWKRERLAEAPEEFREFTQTLHDALPARDTRPVFDRLHVADEGTVWIGIVDDGAARVRWRLFSPDGEPVGQATTDETVTIRWIRGADVIGTRRDDLGREIVEVYANVVTASGS